MEMDDAGLGGTGADAIVDGERTEGAYGLSIERDRMATTVTITVQGATVDDDVEFMQAMDLGGGRTMHVREMEADADGDVVTEVVIVSTDIQAPKAVAFAKWRAMDGMTPQELDANPKTTDGMDRSLAVVTANAAQIVAAEFTAGTAAVLTFKFDNDDTDDTDEADEVAGTYNGAMGTYRCDGDVDCTVDINAMGKVSDVDGMWIFTPAMGATSDQPDYDYLHYGFWLMRTTDADGATTYNEVETFAGSSVEPSGSVTEVVGTAEYSGGAVGVYVKNVFDSKGAIDTATSGHFKANASLMAYFGGDDVTANQEDSVTGTIDKFVLQHGEENTWSVALKGGITGDGVVATGSTDAPDTDGTANGGGPEGSFSATFHGFVEAVEGVVPQPHTVVGEFNANFGNGTAAGGFGARKQ